MKKIIAWNDKYHHRSTNILGWDVSISIAKSTTHHTGVLFSPIKDGMSASPFYRHNEEGEDISFINLIPNNGRVSWTKWENQVLLWKLESKRRWTTLLHSTNKYVHSLIHFFLSPV